jgi:hypothetical protein
MKSAKIFIFCALVSQVTYSQDSISTFSRITDDVYHSFLETCEWYDLPILLTNRFSSNILGSKGELQFIKIKPMEFEKEFSEVLGKSNQTSLGSIDKDIYPTLMIISRLSFSLGQRFLLNEKFSKNDIKHTIVFYKSIVYTNLITEICKGFISKKRPDNTDSRSFFSGHASITFAASTFIFREALDFWDSWEVTKNNSCLKKSFTALSFAGLYGWSGYVGVSRIKDNKHYLADVLVGATVGTLVSNFIYNSYFGTEVEQKTSIKIDQTYNTTYIGLSINF